MMFAGPQHLLYQIGVILGANAQYHEIICLALGLFAHGLRGRSSDSASLKRRNPGKLLLDRLDSGLQLHFIQSRANDACARMRQPRNLPAKRERRLRCGTAIRDRKSTEAGMDERMQPVNAYPHALAGM